MLDIKNFKKNEKFEKELDKMTIEKTGKTSKESRRMLREAFSTGVHPTLESSGYNSDRKTGEYDYELKNAEFRYYSIRNFDFANFIIIPAMQSVYLYHYAFDVSPNSIKKVEDYSNYLQELSTKIRLILS